MKFKDSLRKAYKGMGRSISRYPLTVLFLIAVAVLNSFMIENPREDYARYLFTFLVGAMLSIVGQMVYERFFTQLNARYLLMGGAVLLATGYYFAVGPQTLYNIAIKRQNRCGAVRPYDCLHLDTFDKKCEGAFPPEFFVGYESFLYDRAFFRSVGRRNQRHFLRH